VLAREPDYVEVRRNGLARISKITGQSLRRHNRVVAFTYRAHPRLAFPQITTGRTAYDAYPRRHAEYVTGPSFTTPSPEAAGAKSDRPANPAGFATPAEAVSSQALVGGSRHGCHLA
jgi:hypothetical protein